MQQVLNAASSGDSSVINYSGEQLEIVLSGSFNGATVTLYAKYPEVASWIPVRSGSWTAPEVALLKLVSKCQLKLTISGGSSPSISAWM